MGSQSIFTLCCFCQWQYNSELIEGQVFSAAEYAQVGEGGETSQIHLFHHQHPQQHIPIRVHTKPNHVNHTAIPHAQKERHISRETKFGS